MEKNQFLYIIKQLCQRLVDFQTYMMRALPVLDTLDRQMPQKPLVFHGRDDLVEGIAQLLVREETSRVCILGSGGMGKTAVSLAVVNSPLIKERFPGTDVVWVPCSKATSALFLLQALYIQLQISVDKVTLETIVSELDSVKQPRLIVIDNFETPWNGHQERVGVILRRLAMLSHIAILVTMRENHPPWDEAIEWQSKYVESTDEAASLRIYHDHNPESKNDPYVPRLLTALGHMPFAIELMAKLALEMKFSAESLLDFWFECGGPDIVSEDPNKESLNRSISLSVESDLVKGNPNAIFLLATLSLLPAGATEEDLHCWAPELDIPLAIAALSRAALLVVKDEENSGSPVYFVNPVIRSYMQQHNRIPQEVLKQVHSLSCE